MLDGSGKIKEMVARAKELNMDALAITDHGVMYGCVEFYKACKTAGIKPILGSEIYVCASDMHKRTLHDNAIHHLVLLVKNQTGYQNLMKIVSEGSLSGFYYKPRVDHDFLARHSEGLIALSACLGGEVQENFNHGQNEKARAAALFYKETFQDGFYLELQDHGLAEQKKVNALNIELARELDIPLVCTNDVHYIRPEDVKSHDVLLCIQTQTAVDESDRMKYPSPEFYLKSPEQMWDLFKEVPSALTATRRIADECFFDYDFTQKHVPTFDLPEGVDHGEALEALCYEGLAQKYEVFSFARGQKMTQSLVARMKEQEDPKAKTLNERLQYELSVLNRMGYVDYFLIVWDFIKFADDHGIPTGAGRGSAAASLVAYTLNITKIDPIAYQLLFERFLNPERISMPDIDSDFCYERRQEVIDYVVEKYGQGNVAQIITFGTMAARACIRDVGRAMGYPYGEVDQIAKMVPQVLGITIDKALTMNPELQGAYEKDPRVQELINISRRLEGLPRHASTHAAGVVISGHPLVEEVPLQANDGAIVTQFPMGTLEELGLLKMDFLGLRTLTVMQDAVEMIRENRGVDIALDALDFEDPEVYQMIGEGHTVGVFQLESAGMTSFMKELKPESLEDIIAGISLYRPGPMAEIPRYIENKHHPEQVTYLTPELEPILNVTYGVMIYQEQVMQIVQNLAGYSLGRADLVRRAMSKKKHDVMEKERKNFIEGIVEDGVIKVAGTRRRGIPDEAAEKIFDQMDFFASYAFNKAHAAAYAVIGYQTAYLMHYYPVECIAAMLNSFIGSADKAHFYIRYAKSLGIDVLPPDINESKTRFTVKGNSISFGLGGIKNLGFSFLDAVIAVRQDKGHFQSFGEFVAATEEVGLNKRACECLIKSGALDGFGVARASLLAVYERLLESYSAKRRSVIKGQLSFFEASEALGAPKGLGLGLEAPELPEFPLKDRLQMEKEMTGLYLSGHPLDEYQEELAAVSTVYADDLQSDGLLDDVRDEASLHLEQNLGEDPLYRDGMRVTMGGIVTGITRKITKKNTMMAFAVLEDPTGEVELVIFPQSYESLKGFLREDEVVAVSGRLQMREEEGAKILVEDIVPIERGKTPLFRLGKGRPQTRRTLAPEKKSPEPQGPPSKPVPPSKGKETAQEAADKIYLRFSDRETAQANLRDLGDLLRAHSGSIPLYLYLAKEQRAYRMGPGSCVDGSPELLRELQGLFGSENVKRSGPREGA